MRNALFFVLLAACGVSNGPGTGDQPPVFDPIDVTPKPPACVDCPPQIAVAGGVLDERADQIDYSTGEPVHTHTGAPTALDTGAVCPAIYKYGYLLDTAPVFGRETTQNPLAWQVAIGSTSLDPSLTAYRVRDASGATLLAWTAFDGSSIELHRDGANGIAALGTYAGTLYLDVRARDTQGRETVATSCWDHHPLASPLRADAPVQSMLFGMTLAADSPVSQLFTVGGVPALGATVTQYIAEPVTATFSVDTPKGTYAKSIADRWIATSTQSASIACADLSDPACATQPPPSSADQPISAAFNAAWTLELVDEQTGETVCQPPAGTLTMTCTLPARPAGAQPHAYWIELDATQAFSLMVGYGTQGEYTVAGRTYTGQPPATQTSCSHTRTVIISGTPHYLCDQTTTYTHVVALASASVSFQPFALHLGTAVPQASSQPYAFAPTPAWTWDAGTDVLPGQ